MQGQHIMHDAMEVLTFTLGTEEYGIDILQVQEVRGYDAVTAIANAPEHIKGVLNLRGVIVPIIDMRISFNLGTPNYDGHTVVIILNIGTRVVGAVVDSVSDVMTLDIGQIQPVPKMGTAMNTEHLIGMAVVESRMLILMNIERLLSGEAIGLLEQIAA